MNKQQSRDRMYAIRFTQEERERLDAIAEDYCTTGSSIVRLALKRFFEKNERNGHLANEPVSVEPPKQPAPIHW